MEVSGQPRPLYPRDRTPVPIKWEIGWAPEKVWTSWRREESLEPAGFRTPDLPARVLFSIPTTLSQLQLIVTETMSKNIIW